MMEHVKSEREDRINKEIGNNQGMTETGGTGGYGGTTEAMNTQREAGNQEGGNDKSTERIGNISTGDTNPGKTDIAHFNDEETGA